MPVNLPPWDFLNHLPEVGEQCVIEARQSALAVASASFRRQIVIAAAGFSALAGECLQALSFTVSGVPVFVNRGYTLPAFVGPDTLVIAVSPTGTTEEIVYALSDASDRRAQVWVLTGPGGHLRDMAQAQGYPILTLPSDLSDPIAELTCIFWTLWAVLGETVVGESDPAATFALLNRQKSAFGPSASADRNPARQLAVALLNTIPLISGATGVAGSSARVWKALFSTVGRVPAFCVLFPEIETEDALAWSALMGRPYGPKPQPYTSVLIRDRADTTLVSNRLDALRERWHQNLPDLSFHELTADGDTPLARLWTAIHFGIWTAHYLSEF